MPSRALQKGIAVLCLAAPGVAGCAPDGYDEDPLFTPVGDLEVPAIQSTGDLLAKTEDLAAAENQGEDLMARGDALRARAEDLRNTN